MKPIVSVIVPCYNQAQYLPDALQCLLNQDFQDWECIIVNDGSPDNTEDVAKAWVEKDSRFKYYYKDNSGVCDTRNFAVSKAEGEFILPLDGDDRIAPQYMAEAVDVFRKNPKIKVVYCNTQLTGDRTNKVEDTPFSFADFIITNQLPNSCFCRKKDFEKVGGYKANMKGGLEDWEFWISLIQPDDIVVKLKGYYYYYRIKEVSRSTQIDRDKNEALLLQIYKNHEDLYLNYVNPIRDRIQAKYFEKEARKAYWSAEFKLGAFLLFPFRWIQKRYRHLQNK